MNKKMIYMITLFFLGVHALGQENQRHEMYYKAYVQASQTLWKNAIEEIETELVHHQGESTLQYELVYAQYGLMYSTFAHKDKATFDEYIDEAKERMEKLLLSEPENPHYHLMMSSLYDAEISYAPWKAMYLSGKSEKHVGRAYKLNKNLPMVWVRKAVSKFFTPEMFGGDKKEALENYKKAILLFEKDTTSLKYNWEYLDALTWMGITYQKLGEKENAVQTFEKIMRIESDFGWVKFVLLPAAQKMQ